MRESAREREAHTYEQRPGSNVEQHTPPDTQIARAEILDMTADTPGSVPERRADSPRRAWRDSCVVASDVGGGQRSCEFWSSPRSRLAPIPSAHPGSLYWAQAGVMKEED